MAAKQQRTRRFLSGILLGILPIFAASVFVPWWKFLAFRNARGLEVGSPYASILWFLHFFLAIFVEWTWVRAWLEVTGQGAIAILPYAPIWFLAAMALSTSLAVAVSARIHSKDGSLPELAKLMLFVLLPFVAFNIVLSPQYMIWLLILAALASLSKPVFPALLIPFAAILTPIWYPSPEFSTGLNLFQTTILLLRNILLILA